MIRTSSSRRGPTIFLRGVLVVTAIVALALLLWEPHLEGRNAHATPFEIYFQDPFLAYVYLASIAFFVALHQAYRLLGSVAEGTVFSGDSVRALRTIKRCAIALVVMIGGALAYIVIFVRGTDDIAGGVAIGLVLSLLSTIVATTAAMFEKLLQDVVDMKSGASAPA